MKQDIELMSNFYLQRNFISWESTYWINIKTVIKAGKTYLDIS